MEFILSKQELQCYREIAKHKGISIADLSRHTGIFRPQLYKLLMQLTEQQLIRTEKIGKRTHYILSSEENLKSRIQSTLHAVERSGKDLISEVFGSNSITRIYGKSEITTMFTNIAENLDEQGAWYAYSSGTPATIEPYLPASFHMDHNSRSLWGYTITPNPRPETLPQSFEIHSINDPEVPPDCLWITYSNKLLFIDFTTESGYIITDANMSAFQQSIMRSKFNN